MSLLRFPRSKPWTTQPQGQFRLAKEIVPANSCVYLPSAGAIDLATGKSLSVTGTPQIVTNKRGTAVYTKPSTGAYYRTLVAGDGIRNRDQYILFGVYELTPYDGTYDAIAVDLSGGYGTRIYLGSHGNYQTPAAVGCYVRPNNDAQALDSTFFASANTKTVSAALFVKSGKNPVLIAQHEDGFYEELTLSAATANANDAFNMISFASTGYQLSTPNPGARRMMLGGVLAQGNASLQLARDIAKNPWATIFAPQQRNLFIAAAAGGSATDLSIPDSQHAHAADSLSLSWNDLLAVAESNHLHTADGLSLSSETFLNVLECGHTHAADNLALSWNAVISVAEAMHAHSAESLALSSSAFLGIAEAVHAHLGDNLTLDASNATPLITQGASHGHSADSLGLTLSTWLAVVDAYHAHPADGVSLSSQQALLVAEALHAHFADMPHLSLPGEIVFVRALSGLGPSIILAGSRRPAQSPTSRPGSTGGTRH